MIEQERATVRHVKAEMDNHLIPLLGGIKCVTFGTQDLKDYRKARKQERGKRDRPKANATINREIDALRRAWNLAREHEPPLIYRYFPKIEDLPEDNIRQGFFEDSVFDAMLRELPE
jgi:hypothetical protein